MTKTEEATSEHAQSKKDAEESLKHPPIIVDLGVNSRGKIEQLKRSAGPLYHAVAETVEILQTDGVVAKNAQVVVVVVEKLVRVSDVFEPRAWS